MSFGARTSEHGHNSTSVGNCKKRNSPCEPSHRYRKHESSLKLFSLIAASVEKLVVVVESS